MSYSWNDCNKGHKDVVQLLLEHSDPRIDLNVRAKSGRTALMIASQSGHQDIVQLLLDHSERIDLNARDSCGQTALMLACFTEHKDVVQLRPEHLFFENKYM